MLEAGKTSLWLQVVVMFVNTATTGALAKTEQAENIQQVFTVLLLLAAARRTCCQVNQDSGVQALGLYVTGLYIIQVIAMGAVAALSMHINVLLMLLVKKRRNR